MAVVGGAARVTSAIMGDSLNGNAGVDSTQRRNGMNHERPVSASLTDSRATREANKRALARAMAGISSLDVEAVRAELHDDVVMQLPYEDAVPDLDKSGICELLTGVLFTMYKQCDITFTDLYELVDPDQLIARYIGDFRGRDKDVRYANRYIAVFAFCDGKITLWCEYDNPLIVQASLADFAEMPDSDAARVERLDG